MKPKIITQLVSDILFKTRISIAQFFHCLIQSVPDFKGSAVASSLKSICYYFSIVGFISCFSLDVAEGALLSCRRGGLQDAWLVTGSRMADCFVSVQ